MKQTQRNKHRFRYRSSHNNFSRKTRSSIERSTELRFRRVTYESYYKPERHRTNRYRRNTTTSCHHKRITKNRQSKPTPHAPTNTHGNNPGGKQCSPRTTASKSTGFEDTRLRYRHKGTTPRRRPTQQSKYNKKNRPRINRPR